MVIPETFASSVLPPQRATATPCFPRRSSKNLKQVCPRFLWSLCFAPGPCAHESLYALFKSRLSVSPSPMELLHTSPAGPQGQVLCGLLLPMPDPQAWEPNMGLRTLPPLGESLRYSYFTVGGLPAWRVWGCLYGLIVPLIVLMWPPLCLLE